MEEIAFFIIEKKGRKPTAQEQEALPADGV